MLFKYSKENNIDKYYFFIHKNYKGSIFDQYLVERSKLSEEPVETNSYTFISDAPGHKKIADILQGVYKIPTYQRGYRWDSMNVRKLLEDIYEEKLFENMNQEIEMNIKTYGNFNALKHHVASRNPDTDNWEIKEAYKYCIQPLVVMRKGRMNEYDVVDGQQRLTTIAIILSALRFCKGMYGSVNSEKTGIRINYESRPGSKELLHFISDMKVVNAEEEIKNLIENYEFQQWIWEAFRKDNHYENNIDFEHIINSFQISVAFFLDKMNGFKRTFGDNHLADYCDYLQFVLLNCTEVIWYIADQVDGNYNEIDERKIFANFNTGKLPLTNAELIKAMFMNPSNYGAKDNGGAIKDRQIVIAEKWDAIETELHNPDFWSFVPHPSQYDDNNKVSRYNDTRIDVIFDFLIMRNWLEKNKSGNNRQDVNKYIIQHKNAFLDKYHTFNEIEKWINDELQHAGSSEKKREVMDKCWDEVRDIFTSLKEFYDDDGRNPENSSKLYNLIGFYIYANNTRKENGSYYTSYTNNGITNDVGEDAYLRIYGFLYELSRKPRKEREKHVKREIKKLLGFSSGGAIQEYVKSISYDKNNSSIAVLLLLYNIALLNKSGGIGNRFHFSEYAKQTWQREHIFAQDEDYLKDNRLIVERKAALQSLAKGFDNEDIEAGLKENSFMQYINFINNYPLDYCPVGDKDQDGKPLPVDGAAIKEFKNRYNNSSGYNKEFAVALTARDQVKKLLDMYDWLDAAKSINDEYDHYKTVKNKRSKAELIEIILKYREDNTRFFGSIVINLLNYITENIENYLKKDQDTYIFDSERFSQNILDNLQIDLKTMRNNPLAEFVSHHQEMETAKVEFNDWLNETVEGEKDKKLDAINKIIKDRYVKKLKETLWFNLEDKNKLFDMCDEGASLQDLANFYSALRNSNRNDAVDDENDDDMPDVNDYVNDEPLDNAENEDETTPDESSETIDDVDDIKREFEITDQDIDYIMIAIKSHIEIISKKIDLFFEENYSRILNDHSMGNLTLLSASVNSSIKNKSYFEKCVEVYQAFKRGNFIPLGTVLVFTDLYTKSLNSATQWLPESRLEYFKDLTDTLVHFFDGVEIDE